MRKLITLALLAATAMPAAAGAQSNAELRRDRQDIRQEQRELDRARARGDRSDVREQRDDLREARQEYREDRRGRYGNDDWRDWRGRNRALYAGGTWRAPFRYNQFRDGGRIAPSYYGRNYWVADPGRYHLAQPIGAQRWVRHYNDLLLVDTRRGYVVRVIRNFYY